MTDIKELALRYAEAAGAKGFHWDGSLYDFVEPFLAAYLAEQNPVAWYIENNYYDSLEEAQYFCDNKAQLAERVTPLYTADQLRQAKVKVLRELGNKLGEKGSFNEAHVAMEMADELERSKT